MVKNRGWIKWQGPGDRHLINRVQWGAEEREALEAVLNSDWFGYGPFNKEFEKKFERFTGLGNVHLTNSGSAAIENGLLALREDGGWSQGDLVLHPVTTFATSISSAINLGLTPVFVETKPHTYVIDPEQVAEAVKKFPKIRGLILPHLIGNVPDLDKIKDILGKRRFILEDCCDTLGSKYAGKHVGNFGDVAAYSFYASHHITSGGVGGAIGTNQKHLAEIIKSSIFWGREFRSGDKQFLKRYEYRTLGTDSQMTAIQAAFGSKQMDRLPKIIEERKEQFNEMTSLLESSGFFYLPAVEKKADPSWFAFPLTLKDSAPFNRDQIAEYLTSNNVEVRPLMCGNITKQMPFEKSSWLSLKKGHFPIGDEIENKSLFIPCWGMPKEQREHYYGVLRDFFGNHEGKPY